MGGPADTTASPLAATAKKEKRMVYPNWKLRIKAPVDAVHLPLGEYHNETEIQKDQAESNQTYG